MSTIAELLVQRREQGRNETALRKIADAGPPGFKWGLLSQALGCGATLLRQITSELEEQGWICGHLGPQGRRGGPRPVILYHVDHCPTREHAPLVPTTDPGGS